MVRSISLLLAAVAFVCWSVQAKELPTNLVFVNYNATEFVDVTDFCGQWETICRSQVELTVQCMTSTNPSAAVSPVGTEKLGRPEFADLLGNSPSTASCLTLLILHRLN